MHTLHDFFMVTKGYEYLIAVVFFVLFISFWRFLNKGKR
jgi:hypothetical protein